MDAALYFMLADSIARASGLQDLASIADRVATTEMHSLERRVLERALRGRAAAIALHPQAAESSVPPRPANARGDSAVAAR